MKFTISVKKIDYGNRKEFVEGLLSRLSYQEKIYRLKINSQHAEIHDM